MGGECDREGITEENTPALESASTVSGENQGRGVYYSGLLARMGRESDREEETEGKTPALEINLMLAGLSAYKYWELQKEGLLPLGVAVEWEGGEGLNCSGQEWNKEHFLSFVQCQKSVNDARNLEQSVSMVKSHLCDRAHKKDSQQLRQTLPRLKEKIFRTKQALDNCTHARPAADDWAV
ncbi:hypothetical protein MAR_021160 [Mya arenaria]|uniref:Uncharacterized protein n=1 Tax=Mya arenaria TaxID=6604 RepID=A0ABY7EAW4_MYAAR|nr:hypothetical protein MAR_021160 [Mya arenaria]